MTVTLHIAYRYGDHRIFARLVCLLRGGDSAHVEVAVPLENGTWACVSSSWLDGGPRLVVMPLPAEKWRIYQTGLPVHKADDWLNLNRGKGYGWWRLLRFVLPFFRPGGGGPVCTSAVAEIIGLPRPEIWDLIGHEAAVSWRYERVQ